MSALARRKHVWMAAACSCALLLACSDGASPSKADAAKAGKSALPAISVTATTALQRDLPVQLEATGAVVPVTSVDVKPQLTAVVTGVHVREGQFVNKGDLLFTLDTRADEANVARLRAQMQRDEASLADAQRQLARSRELLEQKFISQGAVDTAQSQVDAQAALVASDKAAIDAARVNLAYGRVTAPSAGRVGMVSIYPGTAVQANQTTLVTVTQLDPIDVAFSVPQRHLADVLGALKQGGAVVTAALPEGNSAVNGRLLFVDNAVDAGSGTVKVKARFDNRDGKLWPGAFAKATLNVATIKDAIVIPQAAIIQGAKGPIVYTIDNGKAALRPVQVLATEGDQAAVKGISAGDRVVLDGRQNLRPGAPVIERGREGGPSNGNSPASAATTPN
jgi:RND family efflux transporter MFP subunit